MIYADNLSKYKQFEIHLNSGNVIVVKPKKYGTATNTILQCVFDFYTQTNADEYTVATMYVFVHLYDDHLYLADLHFRTKADNEYTTNGITRVYGIDY